MFLTYGSSISNQSSVLTSYIRARACKIADTANLTNGDLYKLSDTIYCNSSRTVSIARIYKSETSMTGVSIKFQFDNSAGSTTIEGLNCLKLWEYAASGTGLVYGIIVLDEPLTIEAGETVNITVKLDDIKPDIPDTVTAD